MPDIDYGEILEALNDKVDLDGSWSFPSADYEDLTLGTSGTSYTAPADGYYVVNFHYTGGGYSRFDWDDKWIALNGTADWNNPYIIPMKKGKVMTVSYSACSTNTFRFYYAQKTN